MTLRRLEAKEFITDLPRFPDYPHSEWRRRIKRAQELMRENEVDLLLLFKKEDVRYFFGFQTTHWEFPSIQPAVGLIPSEGEPGLVVAQLVVINAQAYCWTRNIWYQLEPHDRVSQRELPIEIASVIKALGYGNKNIGLEMGPLGHIWIPRPLNDIEALKNALPNARFLDGDKVIWGCRMIKSPLEIERIRQAVRVTALCHAAVVEQFRPGMNEMDIGKIILRVEVESGDFRGDDVSTAVSLTANLEKEGICDILAEDDVIITRNDYLKIDLQHRHKGYWADIARCFQFGPMTDKINRVYDLCEQGIRAGEEMLKPGVPAKEVHHSAVKPIIKAGLPPLTESGHGIGMDVHEPPMLTLNNDMILQEGMVVALESWSHDSLRRSGGTGVVGLEDQYVITESGFERIPGLNMSIRQVAHPFK